MVSLQAVETTVLIFQTTTSRTSITTVGPLYLHLIKYPCNPSLNTNYLPQALEICVMTTLTETVLRILRTTVPWWLTRIRRKVTPLLK